MKMAEVITRKSKSDEHVEDLRKKFEADQESASLERLNFRLSDAIREGATVAPKANGWGDGDTVCALHGAVISATARGYMKQ